VSCLLSAIVVAYADEEFVARCLSSVERALAEVDGRSEAILVLNRPMEDLRREISGSWTLVEPGRNLGFAAGVTAGLSRAHGEWVALVNDDCVVEPSAIAEMVAAGAEGDDIGSVAAQILFADQRNTINSAGIEVDELGIAHERLLGEESGARGTDRVEVFGACAAAALYRRAMLDEIGGFDESFFAYLEDADLAWRARMAGWRCVYACGAVVRHHHSSSLGHRTGDKYYLVGRNRVRMLAKNAARSQLLLSLPRMVLYDSAYICYAAASSRTLKPLFGRVSGLREWHRYRAAGTRWRRPLPLASSDGLRGALRRDRLYLGGG
jgi:GT2 family glycosyltransferase